MDRSPGRSTSRGLALALLLASCGQQPPQPQSAASEVVDCGAEETRHGEGLSVEGRNCLMDAFEAGGQAIFASSAVTVEGAPIGYELRTYAEAPVVMVVHARNDTLGSGKIETYLCERLVPVHEWNEVTGSGLPAESVWVHDGCVPVNDR